MHELHDGVERVVEHWTFELVVLLDGNHAVEEETDAEEIRIVAIQTGWE